MLYVKKFNGLIAAVTALTVFTSASAQAVTLRVVTPKKAPPSVKSSVLVVKGNLTRAVFFGKDAERVAHEANLAFDPASQVVVGSGSVVEAYARQVVKAKHFLSGAKGVIQEVKNGEDLMIQALKVSGGGNPHLEASQLSAGGDELGMGAKLGYKHQPDSAMAGGFESFLFALGCIALLPICLFMPALAFEGML